MVAPRADVAELCRALHGGRYPKHRIHRAGPPAGREGGVGRVAALSASTSVAALFATAL